MGNNEHICKRGNETVPPQNKKEGNQADEQVWPYLILVLRPLAHCSFFAMEESRCN